MRMVTVGLALALGASAAGATELGFEIRNCEAGQRAIRVRVFDGGDLVQLIPASVVESLPYGQTATLRCDDSSYRLCKITVLIISVDSLSRDYEVPDSYRYQCFFGHRSNPYFDSRCDRCPP